MGAYLIPSPTNLTADPRTGMHEPERDTLERSRIPTQLSLALWWHGDSSAEPQIPGTDYLPKTQDPSWQAVNHQVSGNGGHQV